jgi:hypothetical protein
MKTIVDMANGAVTGIVLKGTSGDIPKLDSCPSCALTKSRHLPYKTGRTRDGTARAHPRGFGWANACGTSQSLQVRLHIDG